MLNHPKKTASLSLAGAAVGGAGSPLVADLVIKKAPLPATTWISPACGDDAPVLTNDFPTTTLAARTKSFLLISDGDVGASLFLLHILWQQGQI